MCVSAGASSQVPSLALRCARLRSARVWVLVASTVACRKRLPSLHTWRPSGSRAARRPSACKLACAAVVPRHAAATAAAPFGRTRGSALGSRQAAGKDRRWCCVPPRQRVLQALHQRRPLRPPSPQRRQARLLPRWQPRRLRRSHSARCCRCCCRRPLGLVIQVRAARSSTAERVRVTRACLRANMRRPRALARAAP